MGLNHCLLGKMVAQKSGDNRSIRPTEKIHSEKIEGHRRTTQFRLYDVLNRRVDRYVVNIDQHPPNTEQGHERNQGALWLANRQINARCRNQQCQGCDNHPPSRTFPPCPISCPPSGNQSDNSHTAEDDGGNQIGIFNPKSMMASHIERKKYIDGISVKIMECS